MEHLFQEQFRRSFGSTTGSGSPPCDVSCDTMGKRRNFVLCVYFFFFSFRLYRVRKLFDLFSVRESKEEVIPTVECVTFFSSHVTRSNFNSRRFLNRSWNRFPFLASSERRERDGFLHPRGPTHREGSSHYTPVTIRFPVQMRWKSELSPVVRERGDGDRCNRTRRPCSLMSYTSFDMSAFFRIISGLKGSLNS